MKTKPLVVGVTGGIGAGKSLVSEVFAVLGIPVFSADQVAKELVQSDERLKSKIKTFLGEEAYDEGGNYNVPYVKAKVLSDAALLDKLNAIIHPAVGDYFEKWLAEQSTVFVLKESALVLSHNLTGFDKLIFVDADIQTRLARVLSRDKNRTTEEVERIISNQQQEVTDPRVDFVVSNGQEDKVLAQCLKIFKDLSA